MFHLAYGPLGSADAGPVGIEIENQALAVAQTAQLGDLVAAEGRTQGGNAIGNAGGMEGDHIEIALHHHRPVIATDRLGSPIQAKEMATLLKDLGFW